MRTLEKIVFGTLLIFSGLAGAELSYKWVNTEAKHEFNKYVTFVAGGVLGLCSGALIYVGTSKRFDEEYDYESDSRTSCIK